VRLVDVANYSLNTKIGTFSLSNLLLAFVVSLIHHAIINCDNRVIKAIRAQIAHLKPKFTVFF